MKKLPSNWTDNPLMAFEKFLNMMKKKRMKNIPPEIKKRLYSKKGRISSKPYEPKSKISPLTHKYIGEIMAIAYKSHLMPVVRGSNLYRHKFKHKPKIYLYRDELIIKGIEFKEMKGFIS